MIKGQRIKRSSSDGCSGGGGGGGGNDDGYDNVIRPAWRNPARTSVCVCVCVRARLRRRITYAFSRIYTRRRSRSL
jgi:hypothetical protein